MAYGAAFAGIAAWLAHVPFTFDGTVRYIASLAYLAIVGSIVAFAAYLTLLQRVGAGRASYVGVATPVIAMLLSSIVEGYRWTWPGIGGVALAVAGNVLVLRGRSNGERDRGNCKTAAAPR